MGASGGIGQPLSLLLKNSPLVSELSLYDIAHTPGVAADLGHIETRAKVTGTESILICSFSISTKDSDSSVVSELKYLFRIHHKD